MGVQQAAAQVGLRCLAGLPGFDDRKARAALLVWNEVARLLRAGFPEQRFR